MTLHRLQVLGFRGFRQTGVVNFAQPNNDPGSGLTIITGPNNSGKSSILECLRTRTGDVSFTAGTRNSELQQVNIVISFDDGDEIVESVARGSSEVRRHNIRNSRRVFVLPSRRAFNPYFGKSIFDREQYLSQSSLPHQRSSVLNQFSFRLFNIIKSPDIFNREVEKVLGYCPNWTIDQSDQGQYFLKIFNGNGYHSSDGMGEGVVSVFSIVDSLYDSLPGEMIAIDEPELSLHPTLQKRLNALLMEYAKDRQIVVSTHSPYFTDLNALRNGCTVLRVVTGDDGTIINQLSQKSIDAINRLSDGNIYNPHIFGLDAKELFFLDDRVILTEGQEDVLFYPDIYKQLGIQLNGVFFGWGAGGASNIPHLCVILKDLGFRKVVGIFGRDKEVLQRELSHRYPEYKFFCIPANDVRDKKAVKAREEVEGLLDGNRNIKEKYKYTTAKMLAEISEALR